MKHAILALLFSFYCLAAGATGLEIEDVRYNFVNINGQLTDFSAEFTISWDNAWRNDRNHDAAWVFFKLSKPGAQEPHLKVDPARLQVVDIRKREGPQAELLASPDSLGIFVQAASKHRGPVYWNLKVHFKHPPEGFKAWEYTLNVQGIEMVYIPEGAFVLGDPDTTSLSYNAFYQSGPAGEFGGLYTIDSEGPIAVGPEEGSLYYRSEEPIYNGDQQGSVPAAFPKGFAAYYIMKYEISQGQYAAFLNSLGPTSAAHRANFGGSDYYEKRGTIRYEEGKYKAHAPDRPLNFVSWEDGIAFADWAALRPMTEFEYTKACRGPRQPVAHEYPWGTSERAQIARIVDSEDKLGLIHGYTEADLSDATLPYLGASYYWVMDLAGSVWERVVTPGDELGRQFTGRHGDGAPGYLGKATVEGWPRDDDHEGGYGYRGGGFYEQGQSFSDINPYSPVAYRPYGSWSGGPRYISYGFRCVRTAR